MRKSAKSIAKQFPRVPVRAEDETRLVVHEVIRSAVREMASVLDVKMSALTWHMVCYYWLKVYHPEPAGEERLEEILQAAYNSRYEQDEDEEEYEEEYDDE